MEEAPKPAEVAERAWSRRSDVTAEAYRDCIRRFSEWFGADEEAALAAVGSSEPEQADAILFQWEDAQRAMTVPSNTIAQGLSALRVFLAQAQLEGLQPIGPAHGPSMGYLGYRGMRWLGSDQEHLLWKHTHLQAGIPRARLLLLLHLFMDLGAKTGEVIPMLVTDWEPGRGVWLGVDGKRRLIPIELCKPFLFEAWLKARESRQTSYLIPALSGRVMGSDARVQPRVVNRWIVELGKSCGLEELNPTILRDTAIFKLLRRYKGRVDTVAKLVRVDVQNMRQKERKMRESSEASWAVDGAIKWGTLTRSSE